jgi:signal transduction histidine kinase
MNTQVLTAIQFDGLLQKVLKSLEEEIKDTQANITFDFSSVNHITSLHPYLESIFYNLVSNAIKYRHPGRIPRIHIESRPVDSYVIITFADNGLGIDLEKHGENLFNLYKRFHFHTEGKGMGLYLVKTQLAALGGKIDVRSYINEGTVFSVYLKQG